MFVETLEADERGGLSRHLQLSIIAFLRRMAIPCGLVAECP